MADTNEQTKAYIAGLLRERAGWEQKSGKDAADAIEKITAELQRVGYKAKAPQKRAEKRAGKR